MKHSKLPIKDRVRNRLSWVNQLHNQRDNIGNSYDSWNSSNNIQFAKDIFYSNLFRYILYTTIYFSVLSEPFRNIFFYKTADIAFDILTILVMVIWFFELGLLFTFSKEYKWSIFFWIDLLCLFGLIFDIPVVQQKM